MKESFDLVIKFRLWLEKQTTDYLLNKEADKIIRTFIYAEHIIGVESLPNEKKYSSIFRLLEHEIPNELFVRINKCFAKYGKQIEQTHISV